MSSVIARESEVHKLLTNERILGLDLLRGKKGVPASVAAPSHAADAEDPPGSADEDASGDADTTGLPLFGSDDGGEARR